MSFEDLCIWFMLFCKWMTKIVCCNPYYKLDYFIVFQKITKQLININICFGYKLLNLVNSKGTSHKSKINILNIQTEYNFFYQISFFISYRALICLLEVYDLQFVKIKNKFWLQTILYWKLCQKELLTKLMNDFQSFKKNLNCDSIYLTIY